MALPSLCRLCHASIEAQSVATAHVFEGRQGQAFFQCHQCGVYYQYPPITPEEEKKFYAMEFEKFMACRSGLSGGWQSPEEHIQANASQLERRFKYLSQVLPTNAALNICEIGCSSGFMLYPLKEKGHEVMGVEPSGVFGDFLKSQNISFVSDLDELFDRNEPRQRFDLLLHFFVLEHIRDPVEFLKKNLQLVNNDGIIVFEIPNAADPLVTVYNLPSFERFYWSVAHHWYFTEKALAYVLDQLNCSYEILKDQRYDLSNHFMWAMTGRPGGMGKFSQVYGKELDAHYRQVMIDQGCCDTLVAIIRKKGRT